MKKLYKYISLILIPVLLYLVIFYTIEPYNYFGLKKDTVKSNLVGKMLDYKNGNYNAIVLGDSRAVGLDAVELSERTGYEFINMSYGGAITKEMESLFWWCMENKTEDIKEVVIISGFYNMNTLLQQDRVKSREKITKNPISFAFSIETLSETLSSVFEKDNKTTKDTLNNLTYEERLSRMSEHVENMEYYLKGFRYDTDVINSMAEIGEFCKNNNIKISLVVPPWYSMFYEELEKFDLLDKADDYKEIISKTMSIYDLEYAECDLTDNVNDYTDVSHFRGETFDKFTDLIISKDTKYARVWENGKILD